MRLRFVPLFLLAAALPSNAQHAFSSRFVYGLYAHNSENDLRTTKNADFLALLGFTATYAYYLSEDYGLSLEFTQLAGTAGESLQFSATSASGPAQTDYFYADLLMVEYGIDASLLLRVDQWLRAEAGPSAAVLNRILRVDRNGFEDKLSSKALGAHAGVTVRVPLAGEDGFAIISNVKVRYLHSISFDARGREVGGYEQSFLEALLSVGLQYEF